MTGENCRVAEFIESLQDGFLARNAALGQFIQTFLEVIAQLVRDLLALSRRQAQAAREELEIQFEFLFGHRGLRRG